MAEQNASYLEILSTTFDKLEDIQHKYGQLILVKDKKQLYFDHINDRILYQNVVILENEEEKNNVNTFGLYYIKTEKELYSYQNDGWILIASSKVNRLVDYDTLRDVENPDSSIAGEEDIIYVDGLDRLWRYKGDSWVLLKTDSDVDDIKEEIKQLKENDTLLLAKQDPSGSGSLSLNRKTNTTVGEKSVAVGSGIAATGIASFAEGVDTEATKEAAHAEGRWTSAVSKAAHSEGFDSVAGGTEVTKGSSPISQYEAGSAAHSEGIGTWAKGTAAHSEGYLSQAKGNTAHAEGYQTEALEVAAHAEGEATKAYSTGAHAEGKSTKAGGKTATDIGGSYAHAEGVETVAYARGTHAEGYATTALGDYSHTEGKCTQAIGANSHAEGGYLRQCYLEGTNGKYKLYDSNKTGLPVWLNGYYYDAGEESSVAGQPLDNVKIYNDNYEHIGTIVSTYTVTGDDLYAVIDGIADTLTINSNQIFLISWSKAEGISSHSEGGGLAVGNYSHAEGSLTWAAHQSHAEGHLSASMNTGSHAEGIRSRAHGNASHAEGKNTFAKGEASHAEGLGTVANSTAQHVQGKYNVIDIPLDDTGYGTYAHIVGNGDSDSDRENIHTLDWDGNAWFSGDVTATDTDGTTYSLIDVAKNGSGGGTVTGNYLADNNPTGTGSLSLNRLANSDIGIKSVAVGDGTVASGEGSFAAGRLTKAVTRQAHAEGDCTIAGNEAIDTSDASPIENYPDGSAAHSEGIYSNAKGTASHAEGYQGKATGKAAHAEGKWTNATNEAAHAEGNSTSATGIGAHAEGERTIAEGAYSHAEGGGSWAYREYCHAEGCNDGDQPTIASCKGAHAEGMGTISSGNGSHSEGKGSQALREASHSEGRYTKVEGDCGHAEGEYSTVADGALCGHAEGLDCHANGKYTHAEGQSSTANGNASHVEGYGNTTSADAACAHAEGDENTANGYASHVEGKKNITNAEYQHVQGKFNNPESDKVHIVGWGTGEADNQRANIHTLDTSGNAWFAGDVKATKSDGSLVSLIEIATNGGSVDTSTLMAKNNPNGTGTFSMNGVATGQNSIAFGENTIATGKCSYVEGKDNTTAGDYSHVEGISNNIYAHGKQFKNISTAYCINNHAPLNNATTVSYSYDGENYSYVFYIPLQSANYITLPTVDNSTGKYKGIADFIGLSSSFQSIHNVNVFCSIENIAGGAQALAVYHNDNILGGGYSVYNVSSLEISLVETETPDATAMHVQGKYALIDKSYAHVVGNGTSDTDRSNAHTLDWNGNAVFAGDIQITDQSSNQTLSLLANVPYIIAKGNFIVNGGHTFTLHHCKQAKYNSAGFNINTGVSGSGCGSSCGLYSEEAVFIFRVVGYEYANCQYKPFVLNIALSTSVGLSICTGQSSLTSTVNTPLGGTISLYMTGLNLLRGGLLEGTPQLNIWASSSNIHICELALMP